jgi:hypothetical protein
MATIFWPRFQLDASAARKDLLRIQGCRIRLKTSRANLLSTMSSVFSANNWSLVQVKYWDVRTGC